MKRYLSALFALILVAVIGLTSCGASASGLTGNYRDDTLVVLSGLRTAIELPQDAPNRVETQQKARQLMNDFSALYRRDASLTKLRSYTTMRTALNGLAGHYSSYPNRPIPEKLKSRLQLELNQVESSLSRGL